MGGGEEARMRVLCGILPPRAADTAAAAAAAASATAGLLAIQCALPPDRPAAARFPSTLATCIHRKHNTRQQQQQHAAPGAAPLRSLLSSAARTLTVSCRLVLPRAAGLANCWTLQHRGAVWKVRQAGGWRNAPRHGRPWATEPHLGLAACTGRAAATLLCIATTACIAFTHASSDPTGGGVSAWRDGALSNGRPWLDGGKEPGAGTMRDKAGCWMARPAGCWCEVLLPKAISQTNWCIPSLRHAPSPHTHFSRPGVLSGPAGRPSQRAALPLRLPSAAGRRHQPTLPSFTLPVTEQRGHIRKQRENRAIRQNEHGAWGGSHLDAQAKNTQPGAGSAAPLAPGPRGVGDRGGWALGSQDGTWTPMVQNRGSAKEWQGGERAEPLGGAAASIIVCCRPEPGRSRAANQNQNQDQYCIK